MLFDCIQRLKKYAKIIATSFRIHQFVNHKTNFKFFSVILRDILPFSVNAFFWLLAGIGSSSFLRFMGYLEMLTFEVNFFVKVFCFLAFFSFRKLGENWK
jgi:hypothetical protein